MNQKKDWKQLGVLLGMFVLAVIFWDTIVIYPIKLFVVILHEMSHGLMAELVGGDIIRIEISPRLGGVCWSTRPPGFWPDFLIASAGYLGSLFWGGFILLFASYSKYDKYLTLVIGLVLLWLSWYVLKSGGIFGIIFTLAFAVGLIAAFRWLPDLYHDYLLKFLGLTSALYVVIDINSDLIARSGIGSDADKIAQLTGIPSIFVGLIWLVIALIALFYILRYSLRAPSHVQENEH